MDRKKIKIGLFGFGCVGKGLYSVLGKTNGLKAEIRNICIKDPSKQRSLPAGNFTASAGDLLDDPDINVIVELIDDPDAAFEIVSSALKMGKPVVTANKKMIAEYMEELFCLQQANNTPLLYEAACCASIPLIRNFEEYYDNDLMYSFCGVMNGTTNFILSDMFRNNKSYSDALGYAKLNGYTESNPALDIEGYDSKYKLSVLLTHSFGLTVNPADIFNLGIQRINDFDVKFVKEKVGKIKLIARAQKLHNGKIAAFVLPEIIYDNDELFTVDGVDNGIITENHFADRNIFIGKGAGSLPTAAAVLSDLSALTYNYRYEYKKKQQNNDSYLSNDFFINVYVRFKRDSAILPTEFEELYEKYDSRVYSYITGKIRFNKLVSSQWIGNKEVNIILLNNGISD